MYDINFLNIGYIFLSLLNAVQGLYVDPSTVPAYVAYLAGQVLVLGSAVSVLILALTAYVRIRLIMVEHEGFHGHHDESHPGGVHQETEIIGTQKNSRWEHVLALSTSANEGDWRRAIIEADIMLGNLLTDKGYPGATIGDQLKTANPLQFTTLDVAWTAHKMRNDIAHAGESFRLTERDVRATIAQYARVFEEFGII